MNFAENLSVRRKKTGMTQEQLAERLHVTRQAVSKWESGQAVPDVETFQRICVALETQPNDLLDEQSPNKQKNEKEDTRRNSNQFIMIAVFLMVTLICGTVILLINLFNGSYFEPKLHTLSYLMVVGSMLAFAAMVFLWIFRERKQK
jgi:transcriptional regulator with XRE-family HTH domain